MASFKSVFGSSTIIMFRICDFPSTKCSFTAIFVLVGAIFEFLDGFTNVKKVAFLTFDFVD